MTLRFQQALVALTIGLIISQLFIRNGGVGFVPGVVVFLIGWWTVLFAVLPLRVRGQHETGEIVAGSEPGAPDDPRLKYKAWLTTVIMSGLWLVFFVVVEFELITLDDLNFLTNPAPR